jgi:lysophospholipase L1-like esterase
MKSFIKTSLGIFSGLMLLSACEKQAEPEVAALETAIFSKYISIGGSLSAGYTNGGLYRDGQLNAYPNLIAQQIGQKFDQALFPIGQENGSGYLVASVNNSTGIFDKIVENTAIISTSPLIFTKYSGSLDNYGVAGLRMSDMGKTGLGNAKKQGFNAYFERILPTGKEDISYPDFIKESNPSFFTASIGENDMLDFAISGGKSSLTETSVFALNTQKLFDALAANKAKGIVTNLPNVLDLPFLNFYTFDELAKNIGVSGIYITTGNGIVRLATTSDKILLSAIQNVGKTNASGQKKGTSDLNPLTNDEVLDKDEVNAVASRLSDFNGILKLEAEKRGFIIFDLNNLYTQIKNKTYNSNGINFNNSLLTGSFFSLDGIHPTPRGSAVIANEMIKIINENYKNSLKTAIPTLDVSKFEALKVK